MYAAGPGFSASGAYSYGSDSSQASSNKTASSNSSYSQTISWDAVGPTTTNKATFKTSLGSSNKTHCVISDSFDAQDPTTWVHQPIWKILAPSVDERVVRLLRDAYLDRILNHVTYDDQGNIKDNKLEQCMIDCVEQVLNNQLPGDADDWAVSWAAKLDKCRVRFSVVRLRYDPSTDNLNTDWNDGAWESIEFLDRHNVKVPDDRGCTILTGFCLKTDAPKKKIRYSYTVASVYSDDRINVTNHEDHQTEWQVGTKMEIAFLDRHRVKVPANRVLISFQFKNDANKVCYWYKSAEVQVNGKTVPLVDEKTHYTPWSTGSSIKEICP